MELAPKRRRRTIQVGDHGRISIPKVEWIHATKELKDFVVNYNSKVRNNEDPSGISLPPNVRLEKKRRRVEENDNDNTLAHEYQPNSKRGRKAIRFQVDPKSDEDNSPE